MLVIRVLLACLLSFFSFFFLVFFFFLFFTFFVYLVGLGSFNYPSRSMISIFVRRHMSTVKILACILQYDLRSLYENCEIRELLGKGF